MYVRVCACMCLLMHAQYIPRDTYAVHSLESTLKSKAYLTSEVYVSLGNINNIFELTMITCVIPIANFLTLIRLAMTKIYKWYYLLLSSCDRDVYCSTSTCHKLLKGSCFFLVRCFSI